MLRSNASMSTHAYSPEVDAADVVLDVRHMARWSAHLGDRVRVVPITGARHDVFPVGQTGPRERLPGTRRMADGDHPGYRATLDRCRRGQRDERRNRPVTGGDTTTSSASRSSVRAAETHPDERFDDLVDRDLRGGCLRRHLPECGVHSHQDVRVCRRRGRHGSLRAAVRRPRVVRAADWPAIVERVFGRIDPISAGGKEYRVERCPNITVYPSHVVRRP